MERRKFVKYLTLAGTGFTFTGCKRGGKSQTVSQSEADYPASPALAKDPLKIGFIYQGSVGDFGWAYCHDLGRREMETNLQSQVKTTFVENVNTTADAQKVIRQLALEGNKLIFTTSVEFMNPTIKVAKDFPKVFFENCNGYQKAANVGTYMGRLEETRYLTGMIAGRMTESNTIGFIGAYSIPEVIRGIGAFMQGVRATNPKAKVRVEWVQSWYDPAKEREAAQSLFSSGADVLAQHTDSSAIVQLAEEKDILAFGHNTDMSRFGPNAHLTSDISQWGKYYTERVLAVIDGTWKPEAVWYGIGQGMVDISPMNSIIPPDVQQLVLEKREEFIRGTASPFEGPVKDQTGVLRVSKGETLSDREQLKMDWYVEGVEGSLSTGES
jgi:basic membrane protein A and related proteins